MAFSESLIKARKLAGLSQLQLSQKSGISQQAISKLEKGKSSPSEYTMKQLAAALHVSVTELLEENKKEPADQNSELLNSAIRRVQFLSDPALARLSDFLDGLEAGQEIAAPSPAAGGSSSQGDE